MRGSCAVGFDRYWRSLGRHLPPKNGRFLPQIQAYSHSETGTGRAQAGTTKCLPTALVANRSPRAGGDIHSRQEWDSRPVARARVGYPGVTAATCAACARRVEAGHGPLVHHEAAHFHLRCMAPHARAAVRLPLQLLQERRTAYSEGKVANRNVWGFRVGRIAH